MPVPTRPARRRLLGSAVVALAVASPLIANRPSIGLREQFDLIG